jgi:hypothetical protein
MSDKETRRLARDLFPELRRALPPMREADRAYQKLVRQPDKARRKGVSNASR